MAEVGQAYLQIIPSMKGVAPAISSQLSGVGDSVGKKMGESLTSKVGGAFKTVGKVGVAAIAGVGSAVVGLAATGGISRALKIDQATYKFKAMGIDVEAAMASCNEAVTGTAYGLDAAATVAASLGASGVQAGDQMTQALKATAGMAAMSGRSMEDVGLIFGKVAAQGRLQGDELMQFAESGVNATAALANYLGKTQAEVREMVSAGEIDFQTFSDAMYATFGEAAQGANATFQGAMSNVMAALSRVGAKFADPALDGLRDVFVALIPAIDAVSAALDPAVQAFTRFTSSVSSHAVAGINAFTEAVKAGATPLEAIRSALSAGLENTWLASAASAVTGFVKAVQMGVPPVELLKSHLQSLSDSIAPKIDALAQKFPGIASAIQSIDFSKLGGMAAAIGSVAAGFAVFGPAVSNVAGVVAAMIPKVSSFVGVLKGIPSTAALVGESLMAVFKAWPPAGILGTLKGIGGLFSGMVSPITLVVGAIAALAAGFAYMMTTNEGFRNTVMQLVQQLGASLAPIITTVATQVTMLASTVMPLIMSAIQTVLPVLGQIGMLVLQVVTALAPLATMLVGTLVPILSQIIQIVVQVATTVISAVMPVISTVVAAVSTYIPVIQQVITSVMTAVLSIVNAVWPAIQAVITTVANVIQTVVTVAMDVIQGVITAAMQIISGDWSGAWSTIQSTLSNAWSSIKSAVQSGIDNVVSFFSGLGDRIMGAISGIGSMLYSAGSDLINGLSQGIQDAIGGVVSAVQSGVQQVVDAAKGLLGIASPSKVFAEIGGYTMEGFAEGIDATAATARRSAQSALRSVVDAASSPSMAVRSRSTVEQHAAKSGDTTNNIYIDGASLNASPQLMEAFQTFIGALSRTYGMGVV